jgi:hypothetical protein
LIGLVLMVAMLQVWRYWNLWAWGWALLLCCHSSSVLASKAADGEDDMDRLVCGNVSLAVVSLDPYRAWCG